MRMRYLAMFTPSAGTGRSGYTYDERLCTGSTGRQGGSGDVAPPEGHEPDQHGEEQDAGQEHPAVRVAQRLLAELARRGSARLGEVAGAPLDERLDVLQHRPALEPALEERLHDDALDDDREPEHDADDGGRVPEHEP